MSARVTPEGTRGRAHLSKSFPLFSLAYDKPRVSREARGTMAQRSARKPPSDPRLPADAYPLVSVGRKKGERVSHQEFGKATETWGTKDKAEQGSERYLGQAA